MGRWEGWDAREAKNQAGTYSEMCGRLSPLHTYTQLLEFSGFDLSLAMEIFSSLQCFLVAVPVEPV